MSELVKEFYKFAENHTVTWNKTMTLFCDSTLCDECVLKAITGPNMPTARLENIQYERCNSLTRADIKFIKEQSPEYFI